MSSKKEKSGFGKFLSKVGGIFPEVLSLGETFLSGTPVGPVIGGIKSILGAKGAENAEAVAFLRELERDELAFKQEIMKLEFEDKKNAREMYPESKDFADESGRRILKWNLPYIVGLVGVDSTVAILAEIYDFNAAVVVSVGTLIGVVIQGLLQERGQVVGFIFGSSVGSKDKDKK